MLLAITLFYAQETSITKDTPPLVTKSSNKKLVRLFVKQIKKNLWANYNVGTAKYQINHLSIKDGKDTLVNRVTLNNLDLRPLTEVNLKKLFFNDPSNPFQIDTSPHDRFELTETKIHWLALSLFYDSLHVLDFDFFNNISKYDYEINQEGLITTISFKAARYYTGYFSFNNKNYNLIRVAFKNTKPYDYYVDYGFQQYSSNIEFESHWKYNKVTILLDFKETDKGTLLLTKLDAMQELTQFEFKRYLAYSKNAIDQDKNIKFYTILKMRILE
jgi:hypothetical protein